MRQARSEKQIELVHSELTKVQRRGGPNGLLTSYRYCMILYTKQKNSFTLFYTHLTLAVVLLDVALLLLRLERSVRLLRA